VSIPASITVSVRLADGAVHEYEVRGPEAPAAELRGLVRHIPYLVPADAVIVSARDIEEVCRLVNAPPNGLEEADVPRALAASRTLRQAIRDAAGNDGAP
jgi:hypothetical protein